MERTNSEVERFLLRLGLPQRVIDIFNREPCILEKKLFDRQFMRSQTGVGIDKIVTN